MDQYRLPTVLLAALVLGLGLTPPLKAQESSSAPSVQDASTALEHAERAHLWRVAAWGGANALGGVALVWGTSRSRRSARWHFGAMSAGWGVVNVGIATAGLLGSAAPPPDLTAVLAAERQFHDILLFNLGLNVAYSAVGATMLGAGYRDVSNAERWRGFGTSLVLQGAGLLVLDGIAFFASRTRLADLLARQVDLSLHVQPSRVALALQF
jgi:hypothetical protein